MPLDQIPDQHHLHKNKYGQQNPVEKGMRNYPGQADARLSKCECGNQSQIASSRPVSTEARSMRDFAGNRFSQYFLHGVSGFDPFPWAAFRPVVSSRLRLW